MVIKATVLSAGASVLSKMHDRSLAGYGQAPVDKTVIKSESFALRLVSENSVRSIYA
jgi:hypothetical protein